MNAIVSKAVASVIAARTLEQLLGTYDALFPLLHQQDEPAPVFGVEKQSGVSIERTRKEANAAAQAILKRVGTDHTLLTEEDKAVLRQYSGLGGIGGSIHEYYTPQWVAEGIWDAMAANGMGAGNFLEPSAGAGVFHGTKPRGAIMTATEIDQTSSQINQLLHPEDRVNNSSFETLAVSSEDGTWDGVVGNVPFGETRGSYGALDPEYAHVKYVDAYFVTRMLDKIKAGSMMCVVVPMRIVSGAKFKAFRKEISLKGEFLGAHRLPSGTFSNNGTDTATDILVMRKHPEEFSDLVNSRKTTDLKAANVLWDTFINGKWFETSEGKRFIHGEQSTTGSGKFAREVVDRGNITNAQIKEKLAHKFESRIDWLSLELSEPVAPVYGEGDERLINGRWNRLVNGQWQVISLTASDGDTIDAGTYGVNSISQLTTMINQSPLNALELSYDQVMAVARDFPRVTEGVIADAIKLANAQDPKYRERIIRGVLIGQRIRDMNDEVNQTGIIPIATAAELRDLVNNEIGKYGVSAGDKKIAALTGGTSAAGAWNQFVSATDINGKFSALLTGTLQRGDTKAFDDTDASQTVAYLFGQLNLNPVDLSDFNDLYRGATPPTLSDLAKVSGIAITPDGMLAPMDRATCGNVVETTNKLIAAMATTSDPAILSNYQAQLDMINKRRKWSKVDDIEITMSAKWLPRRYALDFLKEVGYEAFEYSKVTDVDGELVDDKEYNGFDGVFSGYGIRDGKKRSNQNEQFERQLENYLNGVTVRSSDAAAAAGYRARIADIEKRFAIWIRQHDDVQKLTDLYNDKFNGYVPFDHHDGDLELGDDYLSGKVVPFGYQCSGVRRLSEDGRGILAFDTGLGKTASALSLVAYNTKLGRAKRTAIVVPLAVFENWYHEAKTVYSAKFFEQCLFAGIEPVHTQDGMIEQEAVLDDEGNPRTGANGEPLTRDKLRQLSGAEITARMNSIPQTNKAVVVMTKEQFASIPMRPESIEARSEKMVDLGIDSGKLQAMAKNHTQAMKKERAKEKAADTGTLKKLDIPYFEDMGFDNVVIDEGHNYRNSYKAGRESSKLAYLPTAQSAKTAIDLAVKSDYLRNKYDGRGVTLLTATPTVNSPIDIFNMLSHVLSPEEWQAYGIYDADDFVKVFGETEEVMVQKLSGQVENKQGLTGFKNLTGLRSLFHRWVNLKDAKSVSDTVKIPELDEQKTEAPMTEEQAQIYETLRKRAEDLSHAKALGIVETDENGWPIPEDSIFAIIRDMDRVCTDTDLYYKTMTFRFPANKLEEVKQLAADLPTSKTIKATASDKEDEEADTESLTTDSGAKITPDEHAVTLVVHEAFEDEVMKRLKKFGLDKKDVSHPVTPKYARLLENLKNAYENGGKQIIFTEEKSQHNKLERIIAHHLGIPSEEISIINAATVKGKGSEDDLRGLELIGAAFNEGKVKILICNKKAEVGVNLHHGTTDIHHLTLPWTPASIKQRNGRGARVGSKQDKVRVWYYVGKGSFDEFRLETLKHKANWQNELFTSDAERMKNADADDGAEASLLLAQDPEQRKARIAENQRKAEEKIKQAAIIRANIDLHNFLKAAHDAAGDPEVVARDLEQAKALMATLNRTYQNAVNNANQNREYAAESTTMKDWYLRNAKDYDRKAKAALPKLNSARKDVARLERQSTRIASATSTMKRLRPELERAQRDNLLEITSDLLDNGSQYLTDGKKLIKAGSIYNSVSGGKIARVESFNFDTKSAEVTLLYLKGEYQSSKLNTTTWWGLEIFGNETSISMSEIEKLQKMMSSLDLTKAVELLDKAEFSEYLQDGTLTLTGSGYVFYDDEAGFQYESSYRMDKKDLSKVIYPDPKDEALKAKMAAWLLKDRSMLSDYRSEYNWIKAVFGDKPTQAVENYGVKAPEQVINEWLAGRMKAYKDAADTQGELEKLNRLESNVYGWSFDSFAWRNMETPPEYQNISDFEAAVQRGKEILKSEAKTLTDAAQARAATKWQAKWTIAESQTPDQRKDRLNWLDLQLKNASSAYTKSKELIKEADTPYTEDGEFNLALVVSDLKAVGFLERDPSEFTPKVLIAQFQSAALGINSYSNKGKIFNWILELESSKIPAPEPVKEDAQPEPEPAKEEEKTAAETVVKAVKQTGELPQIGKLIMRVNTKSFTTGGGKYKSRGGWRTSPTRTMEVGEWIGIQDPEAFEGVLYKNKDTLKKRIGMENTIFAKNASSEYPDAWWFIPADTDPALLTEILGS